MAQKGINFKITAINKTKTAFAQIGRGLKGVTKAVFSFKTALTGVIGAGALGLLIKQSLTATDRLGKMSNVLGIAVKDLQTLKLASEIGGIEFETFAKATRRLTDNFGDYLNGVGEATVTFQALGISIADANQLSGDQMGILELVADRLNLVENRTLKLKYAQEIFGGRGAELINVLDGGSEALRKFALESERFGSLNAKQVKAVEDFNDSMTRLKTVFFNMVNLVVANLSPAFQELSDLLRGKMLNAMEEAEGGAQQFAKAFAFSIIDGLEIGVKGLEEFANKIIATFNFLIRQYNKLPFLDRADIITTVLDASRYVEKLEELRGIIEKIGSTDGSVFKNQSDNIKKAGEQAEKLEGIYATVYDRLVRLENTSKQFGNTIAKSFEDAVFQAQTLTEAIRNLGANLVRLVYQKTVTEPLAEKISGIINVVLGNAKKQTEDIAKKNRDINLAIFNTNVERIRANTIEASNLAMLDLKIAKEKQVTKEKENQNKAQGTMMLMSGNPLGFLGFMAKGGKVEKNNPYIVGEKGAELFVPNASGTIVPNHRLKASSGGDGGQDSIKVVQQISIMPSVSETARAEIFGMLPLIKQEALNGVMDARNRGGAFARAIGVKA